MNDGVSGRLWQGVALDRLLFGCSR
jgi:hypothetical protein